MSEKPPAKSCAPASQMENNEGNSQITHQAFSGPLITSIPINITRSHQSDFPNAIQSIAEKLPVLLLQKWEKEITKHSEENGGENPGFDMFSKVVQDRARIKNNLNILAANKRPPATPTLPNRRDKEKSNQVLKTDAQPPVHLMHRQKKEGEKIKQCPLPNQPGIP